MPIYLGTDKLDEIYLGATGIDKVYLGTTLVFQKGGPSPGPTGWTLFDHGWVDGFNWTGNYLPRPPYTSIASYNFSNVDTGGYMKLEIDTSYQYSPVNQNCHVCTIGLITVPAGATKMRVNVTPSSFPGEFSYVPTYLKFGLLTPDCVNSMDDTNGGQLSQIIEVTSATNYDLTLDNGIAGNSWIAVVNARATAQGPNATSLSIYKVWFE